MKKIFSVFFCFFLFTTNLFAADFSIGLGYSNINKDNIGSVYDFALMAEDINGFNVYSFAGVNAKMDFSRVAIGVFDNYDRFYYGLGSAINISSQSKFKMSLNLFASTWISNDYKFFVDYDLYYKNLSVGFMYSFESYESYDYQNYSDEYMKESYESFFKKLKTEDVFYDVPYERVEQAFSNSRKILKQRYSDVFFHTVMSDSFSVSVINDSGNLFALDASAFIEGEKIKVHVSADIPDDESEQYRKEFIKILDYELLPLAAFFEKYPNEFLAEIEPIEEVELIDEIAVASIDHKEINKRKPYVENAFEKILESRKKMSKKASYVQKDFAKELDVTANIIESTEKRPFYNCALAEDYFKKALYSLNKAKYMEANIFFWSSIKCDNTNEKAKLGYLKSVVMLLPSAENTVERASYIADIKSVTSSVQVDTLSKEERIDFYALSKRLEKMISFGFYIAGSDGGQDVIARKRNEFEKFSGNYPASRKYFIQGYHFYKQGDYERANLYFWTSVKYDFNNDAAKIWLFKTVTMLMPVAETVVEIEDYYTDIELLFDSIDFNSLNDNYQKLYSEVKLKIDSYLAEKYSIFGSLTR